MSNKKPQIRTSNEILDDLKKIAGIKTDSHLADLLGVRQNYISTWRQRNTIPYNELALFCDVRGISYSALLTGTGPMRREAEGGESQVNDHGERYGGETDLNRFVGGSQGNEREEPHDEFARVPRYDIKVSAGGGTVVHHENIVDHFMFKLSWLKSEGLDWNKLGLVMVTGDSMEPDLRHGDMVLLDTRAQKVRDDAMYCISIDGMVFVKQVQWTPDGLIVQSKNPDYQPIRLDKRASEALIVTGRVVWTCRRM